MLVDVGNSSITVAAGPDTSGTVALIETIALPSDPASERILQARVGDLSRELDSPRPAVSSVVPRLTDLLREALPGCFVVDHETPFPFDLAVADPAAVGADRYCNLAAAAAEGWTTALVVDAGTATTFDVLRDGVFVGGLIAPGLRLAADALGERAARLPRVAPKPLPATPAPDTEGAMAAGAFHVGARGVLGTLEALRAELADPPVVLTGGLAPLIIDAHAGGGGDWHHDPLWTLRGLARLANES
jgi:type III pantothenate kinase